MPQTESPHPALEAGKLETLVAELTRMEALAGRVVSADGRFIQGLAFLLRELRPADLAPFSGLLDLTLPFSADGLKTLTALKEVIDENERLRELSVTDTLTGLYNYRYFRERIDVEIQRVRRSGKPCALIMIDLDRFKPVNDQHGHQAGDDLLRAAADLIRKGVRAVDIPVRYGGDEMAVILPDTNLTSAMKLADRIRAAFEKDPRTAPFRVTGSFGVAVHQLFDQEEATTFIERADMALYRSKAQGGNTVFSLESDRDKEKDTEVTVSERDALFFQMSGS